MDEEKMMILKMLQEGKLSAEEAAKLLESLNTGIRSDDEENEKRELEEEQGKFFRVRITDTKTGKARANIRIPLNVIGIGKRFGAHFAPQIDGIESDDLMQAVRNGKVGKIIDVFHDEDGEHIEIFIE